MIGILNYGAGNVGAILKSFKILNIQATLINHPEDFDKCSKIILPGVGSFDEVMLKLNNSGLLNELNNQVLNKKKYVLGICVGMQVMGSSSDEGTLNGLNWIDGCVKKFDIKKIKQKPYLPHMGWNSIHKKINHPILDDINLNLGFYFVHSYYFKPNLSENILSSTYYSNDFCSSIIKENIIATQFHPEKSHSNGLKLFKNFYHLN